MSKYKSQMGHVNGWSEMGSSTPRVAVGREPRFCIFHKFLDDVHGAGLESILGELLSGSLGYYGIC